MSDQIMDFETYRRKAARDGVRCEMAGGHIIQSLVLNEEGRRLCFLLGTLFQDYLVRMRIRGRVYYDFGVLKLDQDNYLQPDMMVVDSGNAFIYTASEQKPANVMEILSPGVSSFYYMEKAVAYRKAGVKEYWIIDMQEHLVHIYTFITGLEYRRQELGQTLVSRAFPDFEVNISEIMRENGGRLKDLALFSRYKMSGYRADREMLVAEAGGTYGKDEESNYTADAFYDWLSIRRNMNRFAEIIELLFGEIRQQKLPGYSHQHIQGDMYYEINHFLREKKLPYRVCFFPVMVELVRKTPLDSVVMPDLFLMPMSELTENNIYKGVPKWVVEIATPQSAGQDYVDKAQLYQFYGVEEYWIINEWKRKVLVLIYPAGETGKSEGSSVRNSEGHKEAARDVGRNSEGHKEAAENTGRKFEERMYDFKDEIPVASLPGLKIRMQDLLDEPY